MIETLKNVVIYFSLTGNTRRIAELLGETYDAKLIELESGGIKALKVPVHIVKKILKIKIVNVHDLDLEGYDIIFIGGPVWNLRPCPAITDALHNLNLVDKKVIAFICHGGGPRKSRDIMRELVESAGGKLVDVLSFQKGLTDEEILKDFDEALKKQESEETE